MSIMNTYSRIACAGCLAAAVTACRRPALPAPPPTHYEIRGEADPAINRGPDGHPLSVVVRCYQLRDRAAFLRLGFDQAASGRPDAELLEGEALGRDELVMVPGRAHTLRPGLVPGTRYVGLVGLFRRPDPEAWRCLFALEAMSPAPVSREGSWKPWRRRSVAARPVPALAFRIRESALEALAPPPEPIPGQVPGPAPARSGATGSGLPGGRKP
jgi:type VI secretion system protein VasD